MTSDQQAWEQEERTSNFLSLREGYSVTELNARIEYLWQCIEILNKQNDIAMLGILNLASSLNKTTPSP